MTMHVPPEAWVIRIVHRHKSQLESDGDNFGSYEIVDSSSMVKDGKSKTGIEAATPAAGFHGRTCLVCESPHSAGIRTSKGAYLLEAV